MSSNLNPPGYQIMLTKGGTIIVPVPHGWTVTFTYPTPIKLGEVILEGPCDPALTDSRVAHRMKTERAQVTLRFDDTGTFADRCRVRREGQKHMYVSTPPAGAAPWPNGNYVWKHGTTGVASRIGWVLQVLMQNGRGL